MWWLNVRGPCKSAAASAMSRAQLWRLSSSKASSNSTENIINPSEDPMSTPDFFAVHKLFTVKDLFDARVHLGHTYRF